MLSIDEQIKAVRQAIRDIDHEHSQLEIRKKKKGDVLQSLLDDLAEQREGLKCAIETLSAARTIQGILKQYV